MLTVRQYNSAQLSTASICSSVSKPVPKNVRRALLTYSRSCSLMTTPAHLPTKRVPELTLQDCDDAVQSLTEEMADMSPVSPKYKRLNQLRDSYLEQRYSIQ